MLYDIRGEDRRASCSASTSPPASDARPSGTVPATMARKPAWRLPLESMEKASQ